jgi:hypothetical protein
VRRIVKDFVEGAYLNSLAARPLALSLPWIGCKWILLIFQYVSYARTLHAPIAPDLAPGKPPQCGVSAVSATTASIDSAMATLMAN